MSARLSVGNVCRNLDYCEARRKLKPCCYSVAGLETISTLRPPGADIGQRNSMSETDVAQMNKMYNCPSKITTT